MQLIVENALWFLKQISPKIIVLETNVNKNAKNLPINTFLGLRQKWNRDATKHIKTSSLGPRIDKAGFFTGLGADWLICPPEEGGGLSYAQKNRKILEMGSATCMIWLTHQNAFQQRSLWRKKRIFMFTKNLFLLWCLKNGCNMSRPVK